MKRAARGKSMKRTVRFMAVAALVLSGCASLTLKPADFSWSYESVLTTDAGGVARGEPKTLVFDAGALFRAETKNPGTVAGRTVRVIRNAEGFYFLTSPGFRHVYIFDGRNGELVLHKKVLIAEAGMEKPFFNRREQGIQLVDNGRVYFLNKKGIVPGGKK
jgi:hypothetical protein